MNRKDLYNGFNEVDDDILERSEIASKSKKKPAWLKWGAIAACLCLVVSIAIPVLHHKGGFGSQGPSDDMVEPIVLLYLNGALYECFDDPQALKRLGLPAEITAEVAGEHVANIEVGGVVEYQETVRQTDKELFQYAPAPSRAVYVLRDGDNYMAAVFVRTYFPDDRDAYSDLAEVYRIYGIEDAGDIASIAQVDWNRGKIIGAEITGTDAIGEFYALTTDIVNFVSMDNDAFQERVFGDVPEENAPEAHSAFADDQQTIRIETIDGHRFFVSIYLNYGYLYCSGGMAYYQITPELNAWFNEHLK